MLKPFNKFHALLELDFAFKLSKLMISEVVLLLQFNTNSKPFSKLGGPF